MLNKGWKWLSWKTKILKKNFIKKQDIILFKYILINTEGNNGRLPMSCWYLFSLKRSSLLFSISKVKSWSELSTEYEYRSLLFPHYMCIEKHHLEMHIIFPINIFIPEEFEHNKAVIRKSKDRQHNGQMKKDKRTNNHL